MIEVEIWTVARTEDGNAVFLKPLNADLAIPIFIGYSEANAILLGLGVRPVPRPLTHDLMLNIFHETGLDLKRVEIHDLREDTFYARLVLTRKVPDGNPSPDGSRNLNEENQHDPKVTDVNLSERCLVIDSRPSDAIALAVRKKCPILINEYILEQAGIPVRHIIVDAVEHIQGSPQQSKRETLQAELDGAVAAEEYERAAEIRDMLLQLDGEARNL